MATEQTTIAQYALDSNNRRFIIPFEYLSRPFVKVTLMGTDRNLLTVGADYRYISINEIETTRAWGDADGYQSIELRRVTSATDRLVEFSDGSVLRSRDMNVSAVQTIHIAEEARNLASDTLASDDNGNLDARGRRLVNLSDATNLGDAVTYRQVQEWSGSAFSQANRSQIEANRSDARAAAALVSQNLAAASQGAAKTSETNAKTSEINSKASEIASQTAHASKNAAAISEANAKDSEIAALQYRNEASNFVPANHLLKASNLSDVANKATARTNLGLNLTDAEIVKLKSLLVLTDAEIVKLKSLLGAVNVEALSSLVISGAGALYVNRNISAPDVWIRGQGE